MSDKSKYVYKDEERGSAIVGIIVVLAVLGLFVWLFVSLARPNALGAIEANGEAMRGHENTFTCSVAQDKIKDGEKVVWSVNGVKVEETTYKQGEPLTFTYAPEYTGMNSVSVKAGKYRQYANVNVAKPKLTVEAPNIVITYGDEIPEMNYVCSGFVGGDSCEKMNYDGSCCVNCEDNRTKLNAGVYKIEFSKPCCYKDYDVEYVYGTLTVLPKTLRVNNVFEKEYDQSNVIKNPSLSLAGIVEGDDVIAECDALYFEDKNAGDDKVISLAGVRLSGEQGGNYLLEKTAFGRITPKAIDLCGLTVQNKTYDGTARATIEKAGTLNGVIDGDSVAIGQVNVSFDEALVGEREVVVENVVLIGLDKDNYYIEEIHTEPAEINF